MKLGLIFVGSLALGAGMVMGCAAAEGEGEPEPEASESELRSLRAGELAGTIACGETKSLRHSGSPTYRAFAIAATKGQTLDVRVSAAGHDATAWLTTASNYTIKSNNDESAGSRDARIVYTAKSTSTHHVVFRERNYEDDVDFTVTLACSGGTSTDGGVDSGGGGSDAGGPATSDPFDAASCQGVQITQAQAIARIGAGNAFRVVAPPTKLMARKRSCNPVTGCSAWGAAAPASHTYYMAAAGDNYNRPREYDVHFMLSVQGSAIEAVVEDVSNRSRCAGCTPSGIAYNLSTSTVRDHYGDAALFISYPRWSHTSSGFRIMNEWASVPLGPKATTSVTVTDRCARAAVLSKDSQTEYAVLFRY